MTPEIVLQASGHVERFTDLMVTDTLTGDCHRADHLLEHALEAVLEDPKNPPSTQQLQVVPSKPVATREHTVCCLLSRWSFPQLLMTVWCIAGDQGDSEQVG